MTTYRATIALTALLLASACARQEAEHHDHEEHGDAAEARTPEADHAADDARLLAIDPGMLRDLHITTSAVEARPAGEGVTVLGELGVNEDAYVEVGAPIEARVTALRAAVGDRVAAGEALAELQSPALGKARGELVAARARAGLARATLARKRGLAGERIVPKREVQEAEGAAATAEAELQAAEGALRALGVPPEDAIARDADTSRFLLPSPLAGVVIDRAVARGQMVDHSHTLFRVADVSVLWLTVHAFERDAVRVPVGGEARVTLAALPGQTFRGTVARIGQRVDAGSRTLPVRIDLANDDRLLRPGMSASAWVPLGATAETVVAVPGAALQRLHDGWSVFLPRGEGRFEMRPVGRGRDLGGEVEVVAGLAPGETVVVDGAFLLKAEAEKARGEGEHHDH